MTATESGGNRLLLLDIARTVALSGMIVFHLVRDLEAFGMVAQGTTLTGGWAIFARCIAGSFLFLSGVSLVQAHSHGFEAKAWARRVIVIAGAACLVTLATYVAFPSSYVFFGILHAIAVASILGVPFLVAAPWVAIIGAAAILFAFVTTAHSVFSSPWMAWTGLSINLPASMDFIPLVPWLAPFLMGMALARTVPPQRFEPTWPRWVPARALAWPGRNSLAVYLLHQPILVAMVWTATRMTR